jgi:branched-subunit amino acid transport protein
VSWTVLLLMAVGAYAFKAAGLFLFRQVEPSPLVEKAAILVPAALLVALVAVQTFVVDQEIEVLDARVAGVGAGALVLVVWRKAPFLVVVGVAAGVAAALRAVSG